MLPLCDKDLTVRSLCEADLDRLVNYRNDPEVNLFQNWDLPYTMALAHELLAQQANNDDLKPGTGLQLAIDIDNEMVGDMFCHISEDAITANIGFSLDRNYWGRGIIKRAAPILIDYLFEQFQFLTVIRASRDPGNIRDMDTLESVGFVFDEVAPSSVVSRGHLMDDARHSLTRYQWFDRQHRSRLD